MTMHSALAEAVVLIRADGSHLERDVSTHAQKAGEAAGTRMGRGLASTFRRVAGSVLVAEGVRSAVEFADAFEKSRSRLETITGNIGGDFHALQGRIDAVDQSMAALGFTNADTEGSIASLETATRSTSKAIHDQALAADIARGRNISLEEATRILMRVETGHVAMLSKLGIQTKDANGNLLTQKQALEALAQTYGGSASHYADTFAGKQAALHAELQNSAAEIGASLLPAVVDLAGVIEHDIVPVVVRSTHWFEQHEKAIKPIAASVLGLVAALKVYNLWTKLTAETTKLFGRAAVVTTGELSAEAVAARAAAVSSTVATGTGAAAATVGAASAAGAYANAGSVIGRGVSIGGPNLTALSSQAGMAAKNIGLMGAASLGLANLFSNPRSLGFPMGFNNDLGTGRKGKVTINGQTQDYTAHQQFFDSKTNAWYTDPDFKHKVQAASGAADKFAGSEQHIAAATTKANVPLRQQFKNFVDLQNRSLALATSEDSLRDAIHGMAVSAGQNGRALRGNGDAALANREAIHGAVGAALAYVQTMREQHAGQQKVRATALALAQAIEKNATATYGNRDAVVALLRQLHFLPGQIEAALAGSEGIGEQAMNDLIAGIQNRTPAAIEQAKLTASAVYKQLRLDPPGGVQASFVPITTSPKAKKAAAAYGAKIASDVTSGYSPVIDAGAAQAASAGDKAAKAAADAAKARFDRAKQGMQADLSTITGFLDQQRQALEDVAGLGNIPQKTSISGITYDSVSIKSFLRERVHRLELYGRLRRRLKKAGLSQHLLGELDDLGTEAIPAMEELLRDGGAEIKQVNRLDARAVRDARGIAQTQTADRYNRLIHEDLQDLPKKLSKVFAHDLAQVLDDAFKGAQHKAKARP